MHAIFYWDYRVRRSSETFSLPMGRYKIVRLTRVLEANTNPTAIFFDEFDSSIFKSEMY